MSLPKGVRVSPSFKLSSNNEWQNLTDEDGKPLGLVDSIERIKELEGKSDFENANITFFVEQNAELSAQQLETQLNKLRDKFGLSGSVGIRQPEFKNGKVTPTQVYYSHVTRKTVSDTFFDELMSL